MRLATLILLMTLPVQLLSQKVVLYAPKTTAKWPIINNSYSFYVPNTSCDSVVFKCDNGEILPNIKNKCSIYFTPDSLANSIFRVYKKENGNLILIDTIAIIVTESKESFAYLGPKKGGTVSKDLIMALDGIIVRTLMTENHEEASKVYSYRIITIRGDTVETAINEGNRYSDQSIRLLSKLKSADKLLFTDIIIRTYPDRVYHLKPVEFQVE